MTLDELRQHKAMILGIADRYGVSNIRVFGSVVRGEEAPDSDIDLLVYAPASVSLIQFSALCNQLTDVLQARIDVVPEGGLSPYIRQTILDEAIPL